MKYSFQWNTKWSTQQNAHDLDIQRMLVSYGSLYLNNNVKNQNVCKKLVNKDLKVFYVHTDYRMALLFSYM